MSSLIAQPFWTEDFGETDCISGYMVEYYPSDNGSWSVTETGVNGFTPNIWYVSSQEAGMPAGACGESCNPSSENYNSSLHISSNPMGDVGAIYLETAFGYTDSDVRVESPVINCSGQSNIALNMLYLAGGNPPSDRCSVEYFDGTEWTEIEVLTPTSPDCAPRGMWTSVTFSLPASADNNPDVRIGFRWVNLDDGEFSDPSVAIDNISLSGAPISDDFIAAISASTNSVCVGQCIDFTDNSVGTGLNNWTWVFEGAENSLSPDQNPSGICYLSEGIFDVTLTVSNGDESETLTINDFIVVEDCTPEPPETIEIEASSNVIGAGECINFTDFSNAPNSSDWDWTFAGATPNTSSDQNPNNICYNSPGTYDVSLSITLNEETIDSTFTDFITVEGTIGDTPELSIAATENVICIGDCINFSDETANQLLSNWQWIFEGADPALGIVQNPEEVCYLEPGSFDVTLQLEYEGQTYDSTFTDFITVVDSCGPIANFEYTPIVCLGQCYDFENTTTDGNTYFWTFESASPSTSKEVHPGDICYLDETGLFNVTLTAFDEFGSTTSITQVINVVSPNELDAGPDQSVSPGSSTVLSATSDAGGEFFWEPAEQLVCPDCAATATLAIQETTVFTVSFETSGGCVVKDSLTVFVPVSVNEVLSEQITHYPNPAKGIVMLELPQGQWQVNLIDAEGRQLRTFENITSSQLEIDLNDLSRGIYFVNVRSDEGSVVKKLVVE